MLQIHPKTSKIYWSTMFDTTNQLIFFWKIIVYEILFKAISTSIHGDKSNFMHDETINLTKLNHISENVMFWIFKILDAVTFSLIINYFLLTTIHDACIRRETSASRKCGCIHTVAMVGKKNLVEHYVQKLKRNNTLIWK